MFKTTADFKIGQLNILEKQVFEITENNNGLNFYIEGSKNNNLYSLSFSTNISLEEMLQFDLNESIDFIKYVDKNDIVFGKNGAYSLNAEIKIDIMRYLPNSFIIVIGFKDRDNLVGYLELSFSIENCK